MAVEVVGGMEHVYAPNPKMQGEDWKTEYPPIKSNCKWLINKYTGEIVPNIEEFAARSDILEPYTGELADDEISSGIKDVNAALRTAEDDDEGLEAL